MAGLISRLLLGGGKPTRGEADPVQGIGGRTAGTGPMGETGFPGSTSMTRRFPGRNPRSLGSPDWTTIKADSNYGFEQDLMGVQERQASYRADVSGRLGGTNVNPRATPRVQTANTRMRVEMQQTPATQYGGPMMKTGLGNNIIGGSNPLGPSQAAGGHSQRDTTTPWPDAGRVEISGGVPGSSNVRNEIAQRWKNPPGQFHTYRSAPRADQVPVNPSGQASDGNVKMDRPIQYVTVPNRMRFPPSGGNLSWAVMREMPYGGIGNGGRGGHLNGQRRYATGQETQFWNAGQGGYGAARLAGGDYKNPVSFTQPAPWSSQVYTTTQDVGTLDQPNPQPAQQPQAIYFSPPGRRASNSTGRRG